MRTRKLSDEQRAERRCADRERIEQAARALLSSEGWQRWVKVRSSNGLARYSFGNQLLIALQRPDATYTAGFRAFLALNRCVRKGERAIRILAPMTVTVTDQDHGATHTDTEAEHARRTVFRAVSVFDVAQTDPVPGREPVALCPPSQPIEGDSHAHLLPALENLAHELTYTLRFVHDTGTAEGWCDRDKREIVVRGSLSACSTSLGPVDVLAMLFAQIERPAASRLAASVSCGPPSARLAV